MKYNTNVHDAVIRKQGYDKGLNEGVRQGILFGVMASHIVLNRHFGFGDKRLHRHEQLANLLFCDVRDNEDTNYVLHRIKEEYMKLLRMTDDD